jgi:hypothetical protein
VFARNFKPDAKPPPSRSTPSSWDLHAGGLPWLELDSQRDQETRKPAGDYAGGLFAFLEVSDRMKE